MIMVVREAETLRLILSPLSSVQGGNCNAHLPPAPPTNCDAYCTKKAITTCGMLGMHCNWYAHRRRHPADHALCVLATTRPLHIHRSLIAPVVIGAVAPFELPDDAWPSPHLPPPPQPSPHPWLSVEVLCSTPPARGCRTASRAQSTADARASAPCERFAVTMWSSGRWATVASEGDARVK